MSGIPCLTLGNVERSTICLFPLGFSQERRSSTTWIFALFSHRTCADGKALRLRVFGLLKP